MSVLSRLSMLACCLVLTTSGGAGEQDEGDALSGFARHMHEHLGAVSAMKDAVIAGRLDDAKKHASWVATHKLPAGMPKAWQPYVDEMRLYAGRAAAAQNLMTTAAAVSEIARSCGGCHEATGFKVAFGFDERPSAEEQNLTTEMQRHLWAADRMWDGLVGPSGTAWQRGTEILTEVRLSAADITDEPAKRAQVGGLVGRARSLGEQGSMAVSPELRSGLYGEFLSLCASCHSMTGGGPAGQ